MRLYSLKVATVLMLGIVFFTACVKEEERKGCLDITAVNYDPTADVNDGCVFEETTQMIYENGNFGFWGADPIYFLSCTGTQDLIDVPVEPGSAITTPAVVLVTDSFGNFYGFFATSNNHDGRYFSSTTSKLNFTAMLAQEGPNESIETFIRGVEPDDNTGCDPVLASDRLTLMTGDLSATEMTQVQMNILDFDDHNLNGVGVLGGFDYTGAPLDTFLIVNNVNWTNF